MQRATTAVRTCMHGLGLNFTTFALCFLRVCLQLALYMYHSFDRQASSFCPDAEITALFKVRLHMHRCLTILWPAQHMVLTAHQLCAV